MLAQRRSAEVAFGYVTALSPGVRANCWSLAEAAGHEGWGRMQALLSTYRWDWKELRAELPGLAAAWLPDREDDLIGPGIAVDETAQLKKGDATACVAPQHAGCTGKVENCVTSVFSAYVTAAGQAWADFDVYMPERWARDLPRRRAAGIPGDLEFATKPQLAIGQVRRLTAAGLPARWAAFDEVYGRSEDMRKACAKAGLAYVAIVPCDYQVTMPSGKTIRADQAVASAVFERRSCGTGTKGPRISDWALIATGRPRQLLLIRRLISRPGQLTFYLCWAPEDRPATMTYFITIAGRRWPVEETFKTGKDVLGWDQSQARTWEGTCRHTALAALAQLRQAAIRNALCGDISLAPASGAAPGTGRDDSDDDVDDADLAIPLGDAPLPARGGQPCPPGIAPIRLSVAETARLTRLAAQATAGLITRARLAFALRWSARRRRHQATARWHHHSARLLAAITYPRTAGKQVTPRNRQPASTTSLRAAA
ncbi:MAG TPA: IS701 family transposase [Streptosporangiaceae bacterium]|nr:IS701 family transposase [Streptosporangiaceae bacterium]